MVTHNAVLIANELLVTSLTYVPPSAASVVKNSWQVEIFSLYVPTIRSFNFFASGFFHSISSSVLAHTNTQLEVCSRRHFSTKEGLGLVNKYSHLT